MADNTEESRHRAEVGLRMQQARRAKASRENREVLQTELADCAGVTAQSYNQYESGNIGISMHRLPRIARCLGTTTDWLLDGSGDPPSSLPHVPSRSKPKIPPVHPQQKKRRA